jgi:hypothetical protein
MMRAVPDEVQARPSVLELAEVNPAELEVVEANLAEVNPAEVVEANLAVAKLARQTSKKSSAASLMGAVGLGGAAPPSSPFSFRKRSPAKPPPRVDHRRGSLRDQLDLLLVKAALERHTKAPWYVIRPNSHFMGCWDVCTSSALIFTALVTPFEVSFLEPRVDGLFVINRLIDLVFIFDMVLQFFLMYQVPDDEGPVFGRGRWEQRLKPIARHYLQGWFTIDVLSIVPSLFDILPLIKGSGFEDDDDNTSRVKLARAFRTARLIKLVRLIRGSRVLARWRTRITVSFASLSIITLVLELLLASHWLACLLSLQTVFGPRIDSWFGTFGWCTDDPLAVGYDEKTEMACASDKELYLVCLHWGFGIVAGFGPDPETGPYPPLERALEDGGLKRYTDGELVGDMLWYCLSAMGRAYVTARVVAIIVHANPDWTAFKHRMDQLNRYISFYRLPPDIALRLREYFWETRLLMQAQSRRTILEHMTVGLQEVVSENVNQKWLETVPFFRGMQVPDGRQIVQPVEKRFLSKVACALAGGVFAPMEQPPSGRLYVIMGGCARYKGRPRGPGYCWGALDVLLPNINSFLPQPHAVALDYVHVSHIDGQTLRRIATDFPESRRAIRTWTMINGLKEFMRYVLRNASEEQRQAARRWVQASSKRLLTDPKEKIKAGWSPAGPARGPGSSAWLAVPRPTSISGLHEAVEKRLDTMDSSFEQLAVAIQNLEQQLCNPSQKRRRSTSPDVGQASGSA